MKVAVIVLSLAVVCLGRAPRWSLQDNYVMKLITNYGYPAEYYNVTTSDGYILDLYRIPHGVSEAQQGPERRPILLMHGFMSSCEDFIYGGPVDGLAFYLADRGYDVYLGNARGSLYGQRHTKLDPQKDAAFWKFCWNEIGTMDLPTIIDQVLRVSGEEKIDFIGHMQATTAFLAMASQNEDYNNKIGRFIALGPMAFMSHSEHTLLRTVSSHLDSKSWIMKNLGQNSFHLGADLYHDLQSTCMKTVAQNMQDICNNHYFLYNGYNSTNFNETTIRQALSRVPFGGSVREVLAFAQIMSKGQFVRFDDNDFSQNNRQMYEYDLTRVTVPVVMFGAQNDPFSQPDDIAMLKERLPNDRGMVYLSDYNRNMDLIYAKDVGKRFYPLIIDALQMAKESDQKENWK